MQTLLKVDDQRPLSKCELELLLSASGKECDLLYAAARKIRDDYFGKKVFLYGFIYFSTYCKNDCNFCYYRISNTLPVRYRKPIEEIISISKSLKCAGVHLIDLTMGEDPKYHGEDGLPELLFVAEAVKHETGLPVMISPGVIPGHALEKMSKLGIEWYACYQETHNADLFSQLRTFQSYDARLEAKLQAVSYGMLVEEGLLIGVGETLSDIAHSIMQMDRIGASQIRAMTFVPQKGIPLNSEESGDYTRELNTIAVMRIVYPDMLIPASLDVEGKKGLRRRLNSGANVVTSIIAPETGLAGVSNWSLDIENGKRSVAGVADTLDELGLGISELAEYQNTLAALRKKGGANDKTRDYWRKASGA
jgi:methylornithine synthase